MASSSNKPELEPYHSFVEETTRMYMDNHKINGEEALYLAILDADERYPKFQKKSGRHRNNVAPSFAVEKLLSCSAAHHYRSLAKHAHKYHDPSPSATLTLYSSDGSGVLADTDTSHSRSRTEGRHSISAHLSEETPIDEAGLWNLSIEYTPLPDHRKHKSRKHKHRKHKGRKGGDGGGGGGGSRQVIVIPGPYNAGYLVRRLKEAPRDNETLKMCMDFPIFSGSEEALHRRKSVPTPTLRMYVTRHSNGEYYFSGFEVFLNALSRNPSYNGGRRGEHMNERCMSSLPVGAPIKLISDGATSTHLDDGIDYEGISNDESDESIERHLEPSDKENATAIPSRPGDKIYQYPYKGPTLNTIIDTHLTAITKHAGKEFVVDYIVQDTRGDSSSIRGRQGGDYDTTTEARNLSDTLYKLPQLGTTAVALNVLSLYESGAWDKESLHDGKRFMDQMQTAVPVLAGILKEAYDSAKYEYPSAMDMLCHVSGLPEYPPVDGQDALDEIRNSDGITTPPTIQTLTDAMKGGRLKILHKPGIIRHPSVLAFIVLGELLRVHYNKNALSEVISSYLADKVGITDATYEPKNHKLTASSVAHSMEPYIQGDPGVYAGHTGLYGTIKSLALLCQFMLKDSSPHYVKALTEKRYVIGPSTPLHAGCGDWIIDAHTHNPEEVWKLCYEGGLGHTQRVYIYPNRGVSVIILTNLPTSAVGLSNNADLPNAILKSIRNFYKNLPIDKRLHSTRRLGRREPLEIDVPTGRVAYMKSIEEEESKPAVLNEAVSKKDAFLAQFAAPDSLGRETMAKRSFYALAGHDGYVESIRIRDSTESTGGGNRFMEIIKNEDPSNVRLVGYSPRDNGFRVLDPVCMCYSEYFTVSLITFGKKGEDSFYTKGYAVELDGSIYVNHKVHKAIEAYLIQVTDKENASIDTTKADINPEYAANAKKIGSAWPIFLGLAAGALLVSAANTRRHVDYYPPYYVYPGYYRVPYNHTWYVHHISAGMDHHHRRHNEHSKIRNTVASEDVNEAQRKGLLVGHPRHGYRRHGYFKRRPHIYLGGGRFGPPVIAPVVVEQPVAVPVAVPAVQTYPPPSPYLAANTWM